MSARGTPRKVNPEITTPGALVRSIRFLGCPIASSTVRPAPLPRSRTPGRMERNSVNTPGPTATVSPGDAASIAAWIVAKSSGTRSTTPVEYAGSPQPGCATSTLRATSFELCVTAIDSVFVTITASDSVPAATTWVSLASAPSLGRRGRDTSPPAVRSSGEIGISSLYACGVGVSEDTGSPPSDGAVATGASHAVRRSAQERTVERRVTSASERNSSKRSNGADGPGTGSRRGRDTTRFPPRRCPSFSRDEGEWASWMPFALRDSKTQQPLRRTRPYTDRSMRVLGAMGSHAGRESCRAPRVVAPSRPRPGTLGPMAFASRDARGLMAHGTDTIRLSNLQVQTKSAASSDEVPRVRRFELPQQQLPFRERCPERLRRCVGVARNEASKREQLLHRRSPGSPDNVDRVPFVLVLGQDRKREHILLEGLVPTLIASHPMNSDPVAVLRSTPLRSSAHTTDPGVVSMRHGAIST